MTTIQTVIELINRAWEKNANREYANWHPNDLQAQKLLKTALTLDPDNIDLLTCLGAVLSDRGHHQQAIVILEKAVQLGSDDRNTYFNLAVALINSKQHEKAMDFFKQAQQCQRSKNTLAAYFDAQAY
jgi:tetratricopeptide (TPR) repeat protein